MSWHYLPELEEEYLQGTALAGEPYAPLKSIPSVGRCCSDDSVMDAYRVSLSGTTLQHSTESLGVGLLTLSREDFHVRTSALPGRAKASQESGQGYGKRWRELSVKYDLHTHSWKTHRCLWAEDLPWCSVTLPKWGIMLDGVCWEQTMSVRLTGAREYGYWPTPTASIDGTSPKTLAMAMSGELQMSLMRKVMIESKGLTWPTPKVSAGGPNLVRHSNGRTGGDELPTTVAKRQMWASPAEIDADLYGSLNPDWVEWLMGWPIGWTSLELMSQSTWQEWNGMESERWDTDPADVGVMGRVSKKCANRKNRLMAIGNGQVPATLIMAWRVLVN